MTVEISDYLNVRHRAAELGCTIPERLALLPLNFESASVRSDFQQLSEAATVRTLLRTNGLQFDELVPVTERPPYVQNNSFEWLAPTLFISSAVWTENPLAVSVALNVLSNYITDFLKGTVGAKAVKLNVVVEKKGDRSCKKLHYDGDISGLKTLPDIIRTMADE